MLAVLFSHFSSLRRGGVWEVASTHPPRNAHFLFHRVCELLGRENLKLTLSILRQYYTVPSSTDRNPGSTPELSCAESGQ